MNREKKEVLVTIKEGDLDSSGVGKLLFLENKELKEELSSLRKSLKRTQDAFEKLREKFHEVDKEKSVMKYHISSSIIPSLLKFLTTGLFGIFGGYYLSDRQSNSVYLAPSITCFLLFTLLVIFYRFRPERKNK